MKKIQYIGEVISYAYPIAASNWLNLITSFIGMLFVASANHLGLAAGALATISFNVLSVISDTTLYGLSILMGHARGKSNFILMGVLTKNSLWVCLSIGVPCAVITWFMPTILEMLGQNRTLIELSVGYFHVSAFIIVTNSISTIANQFFIGIGKPKTILLIRSIRLPFTIALSYVFVLGKFGVTQFGLTGVALAILLTQMPFLLIKFFLIKNHTNEDYQIFTRNNWLNFKAIKNLYKVGFPIGLQLSGELGARMIGVYMLGLFGAIPLIASEIVNQYSFFVIMATLGISQAVSVLSGEALAKKKTDVAHSYLMAGVWTMLIIMVVIGFIFTIIPKFLILIFIPTHTFISTKIISLATIFFMIAVADLTVDGVRNLLCAALRGSQDSKSPMYIGILCLWVISLPISYIVGIYCKGGVVLLKIAFISGLLVGDVWLFIKLRSVRFCQS